VILANKIDMDNRCIPEREGQEWCVNNGQAPYFETSAKDATNVEEAFKAVIRRIRQLEDVIEMKPSHTTLVLPFQECIYCPCQFC
jgi:GTPase SAR1 family protein